MNLLSANPTKRLGKPASPNSMISVNPESVIRNYAITKKLL